MKGLKIQCPNCRRLDFETTEKYIPDVTPNGSMVKCLLPYHIDWLCSSTTGVSEMTCPECLAQLAPSGRMTVQLMSKEMLAELNENKNADPVPDVEIKKHTCPVCNDGREFKSAIALNGHMKKHEKGAK